MFRNFNVDVKIFNVGLNIMYPVITQCPVCHDPLIVARLYCPSCATAIDGRFSLGRLAKLSEEQLAFVETFVHCEGKLTRMQEELGISYPTVRSRLEDVIRALGYEVDASATAAFVVSEDERRAILADLAAGRITSEVAMNLLQGKNSADA
jgi:hypothetical protein